MKELVVKKCLKCGATVKVLEDCSCENCGIQCCGEKMVKLEPNSVDAAFEKHIPTYEIKDGRVFIKVNHVMEADHYIEWISVVSEEKELTRYFKPGDEPTLDCEYTQGMAVYAYCNKHELWKTEVK